jgi:hypothetical protein
MDFRLENGLKGEITPELYSRVTRLKFYLNFIVRKRFHASKAIA